MIEPTYVPRFRTFTYTFDVFDVRLVSLISASMFFAQPEVAFESMEVKEQRRSSAIEDPGRIGRLKETNANRNVKWRLPNFFITYLSLLSFDVPGVELFDRGYRINAGRFTQSNIGMCPG